MKTDLRVVKTKRAIEQAFFQLVEEKGFENVRIVDIAEKAEVNRNTIYLHYESKEGIIKDVVERELIQKVTELKSEQFIKLKNNRRKIQLFYETLFNIVSEQIEVYRILLTDENLAGYLSMTKRRVESYVMGSFKDTLRNRAVINYIISGVYGTISRWIIYAYGSIEGNIKLLTDLTMSNLRSIQL